MACYGKTLGCYGKKIGGDSAVGGFTWLLVDTKETCKFTSSKVNFLRYHCGAGTSTEDPCTWSHCQSLCADQPQCNYAFFTNNGQCILVDHCTAKKRYNQSGTTYAKWCTNDTQNCAYNKGEAKYCGQTCCKKKPECRYTKDLERCWAHGGDDGDDCVRNDAGNLCDAHCCALKFEADNNSCEYTDHRQGHASDPEIVWTARCVKRVSHHCQLNPIKGRYCDETCCNKWWSDECYYDKVIDTPGLSCLPLGMSGSGRRRVDLLNDDNVEDDETTKLERRLVLDRTCPWHSTTEIEDHFECGDFSLCTGENCCNDHGKRAKCPPNLPHMCAMPNMCADGQDHCCSTDCWAYNPQVIGGTVYSHLGGNRVCDVYCDWKCYLENYPDLKEQFGDDERAAMMHYYQHGKEDHRDCTCSYEGVERRRTENHDYGMRYGDRKAMDTNREGLSIDPAAAEDLLNMKDGTWHV